MVRLPAVARAQAPVGGGAERAGRDVDRRGDAAGMEVVDQAVVADRHAEQRAHRFMAAALGAHGDDARGAQGAVAEVRERGMIARARLHQQRGALRHLRQMLHQLLRRQRRAVLQPIALGAVPPQAGAFAAAAARRLHEQVLREQLRAGAALDLQLAGLDDGEVGQGADVGLGAALQERDLVLGLVSCAWRERRGAGSAAVRSSARSGGCSAGPRPAARDRTSRTCVTRAAAWRGRGKPQLLDRLVQHGLAAIRRIALPLRVVDQAIIANTIDSHAIRASSSPALPSHPRSRHTARK